MRQQKVEKCDMSENMREGTADVMRFVEGVEMFKTIVECLRDP